MLIRCLYIVRTWHAMGISGFLFSVSFFVDSIIWFYG